MRDLAFNDKCFAISLTESHLNDNIQDHEIHMEGWNSIRSDRINRSGGGVITYIKDFMTTSNELLYSDSITESVGVYIHDINMALITIYRPPGCKNDSFLKCIDKIDKWLYDITKDKEKVKIFMTGDFNLGFLKDWNHDVINKIYEETSMRSSEDKIVSDDKHQAVNLIEFCEKWCLVQKVNENTRSNRILDLVFTNSDDLIDDINHIKNEKMSDHDSLVITMSGINDINDKKIEDKKNFCTTKIPEYNTDVFNGDIFVKISDELSSKCWNDITPETLTDFIEDLIVNNCELRNPERKTSEGKSFKSNSRIPRTVRLWLRRKKLASRAIKTVKTAKGCKHLREKIEEAES